MKFENLSALIECSANAVFKLPVLKKYIDIISAMGYTELYLGLTNAYKIESEPYFAFRRAGYTVEQLQEIDNYCKGKGIELRCTMQTLAHLYPLYHHYKFRDMMDTKDALLVGDERVYELIDKMFDTLSRGISSRHINIGLDEAFGLGSGKYYARNGYKDRKKILLEHIKRVMALAKKYNFICEMWNDTLMDSAFSEVKSEDIKRELPNDVRIFYWNYRENNPDKLRSALALTKRYSDNIGYCGSAFKINGTGPQNRYSISRILPQMAVSEEQGVKQYIVSCYGDRGCWSSYFSVLPTMFMAAEFAYGRCTGLGDVDKKRFSEITGADFDELLSLDYLNDPEKREPLKIGNRSGWTFMSDCLCTTYDMFTKEGTGAAYEALAEEYDAKTGGEFDHLFKTSAAAARVLAIKCEYATRLRKAYESRDKTALRSLLDDGQLLEERLQNFKKVFSQYWKHDNYAFGLEIDHLYIGYQIIRIQYIMDCIEDFLQNGTTIDELEEPALPQSVDPDFDEDSLFVYEFDFMLSHGLLE